MDIDAALNEFSQPALPASSDANAAAAAAPAPPSNNIPQLMSSFRDAELLVLDGLLRISNVTANGVPASDQFQNMQTNLHGDPVSVQRALQIISGVPPQHWAQVVAALTPAQREELHRRFLTFGQNLLDDVREMGQGVSALRLVMLRVLPALQALPEDAKFGTSAVLTDNYRVFNTVADVMRPETGQSLAAASDKAAALAAQVTSLTDRMRKAGLHPDVPAQDSTLKTTAIVLGVLLALTLIGLGIAIYFASKNHKKMVNAETTIAAGGRAGTGMLGGVAGGNGTVTTTAQAPYIKFPPLPQWSGAKPT